MIWFWHKNNDAHACWQPIPPFFPKTTLTYGYLNSTIGHCPPLLRKRYPFSWSLLWESLFMFPTKTQKLHRNWHPAPFAKRWRGRPSIVAGEQLICSMFQFDEKTEEHMDDHVCVWWLMRWGQCLLLSLSGPKPFDSYQAFVPLTYTSTCNSVRHCITQKYQINCQPCTQCNVQSVQSLCRGDPVIVQSEPSMEGGRYTIATLTYLLLKQSVYDTVRPNFCGRGAYEYHKLTWKFVSFASVKCGALDKYN